MTSNCRHPCCCSRGFSRRRLNTPSQRPASRPGGQHRERREPAEDHRPPLVPGRKPEVDRSGADDQHQPDDGPRHARALVRRLCHAPALPVPPSPSHRPRQHTSARGVTCLSPPVGRRSPPHRTGGVGRRATWARPRVQGRWPGRGGMSSGGGSLIRPPMWCHIRCRKRCLKRLRKRLRPPNTHLPAKPPSLAPRPRPPTPQSAIAAHRLPAHRHRPRDATRCRRG